MNAIVEEDVSYIELPVNFIQEIIEDPNVDIGRLKDRSEGLGSNDNQTFLSLVDSKDWLFDIAKQDGVTNMDAGPICNIWRLVNSDEGLKGNTEVRLYNLVDSGDLLLKNDDIKLLLKSDEGLLNLNDIGLLNLLDSGDLRENDVTMCIAKNANGLYNSAWICGCLSGNANE